MIESTVCAQYHIPVYYFDRPDITQIQLTFCSYTFGEPVIGSLNVSLIQSIGKRDSGVKMLNKSVDMVRAHTGQSYKS